MHMRSTYICYGNSVHSSVRTSICCLSHTWFVLKWLNIGAYSQTFVTTLQTLIQCLSCLISWRNSRSLFSHLCHVFDNFFVKPVKLEKVTIDNALCNLRQLDVSPGVLGFNYAPASMSSEPPRTHSAPTYQISAKSNSLWRNYWWLNKFSQHVIRAAIFYRIILSDEGTKLYKIWGEHRNIILAPSVYVLGFRYYIVSTQRRLVLKNLGTISRFLTHVKLWDWCAKCLRQFYQFSLGSNPRIYYWQDADARAERLS